MSTGLIDGTATATLVAVPLMLPQLSFNARNSGSDTPSALWFARKSSGEIRNVSDEAAAELANDGVAAVKAATITKADTALRISDWQFAKALDTMLRITFSCDPRFYAVQKFDQDRGSAPHYENGGVRWLKRMQHACHNRGTNRRSNALSR